MRSNAVRLPLAISSFICYLGMRNSSLQFGLVTTTRRYRHVLSSTVVVNNNWDLSTSIIASKSSLSIISSSLSSWRVELEVEGQFYLLDLSYILIYQSLNLWIPIS
jgi:hypothetical protein